MGFREMCPPACTNSFGAVYTFADRRALSAESCKGGILKGLDRKVHSLVFLAVPILAASRSICSVFSVCLVRIWSGSLEGFHQSVSEQFHREANSPLSILKW